MRESRFRRSILPNEIGLAMTQDDSAFLGTKNALFVLGNRCSIHLSYGGKPARASRWLSGMDSNHDKGLQRALCYRYTTGQSRRESTHRLRLCKGKVGLPEARAPH